MKKHTLTAMAAAVLGAAALVAVNAATRPQATSPAPAPQPALPATVQEPASAQPGAPGSAADPATPQAPTAGSVPASAQQAKAERMLRAQVLLERSHFSPGEIDGAFGSNMRQALAGFQQARSLPASGSLDQATWNALNADNAPTLVSYTLQEGDVAGPFVTIPDDMVAKAALPSMGYASALEGLGEKFHASPALLERLNPGKDFSRAGEQVLVPNVAGASPLPRAARVVVSGSRRVLMLQDPGGRTVAQYPASTGSEHDPLPIGTWKITGVSQNPVYNYNPKLFWDASPGDKKVKIAAGPNNPVGVAWLDLSKPHYGIHGTPVPATIGKTESHGCIRLTNWSASEVAQLVAAGTEVVLRD
jgi:lipoprotein-anchoring transpeptidase ErfK/SrfK